MSAPPYMKLYIADYLADTTHLRTVEHGAYLLLLMALWRAGGKLPNDPVKLSRIAQMNADEWADVAPAVLEFFTVKGAILTQKRASLEISRYRAVVNGSRRAGKASASNRLNKNNELESTNVGENVEREINQPKPEPEPELEYILSSSPRTRAPSFDQTEWGERFEQAKEAAGDAADFTRPAMLHARDLRALVEPSSGEPCDWDEVLDAIRMVAARQRTRGKLITTWAWVRDDAIALRDKRLSGNPEPQTHAPHAKPTSLADELATQKANARRRVLEMTEGRDNDQSC